MHSALKPIALIGLMGAGKSEVARALAARLGGGVEDLDARVESRAGCSVKEIFEREGESGFRTREKAALEAAIENGVAVIACGGGLVLDPGNRARLRETCRIVWLEVSPAEAGRRIAEGASSRPLLAGGPLEARLEALLRERAPLYESMAEVRVEAEGAPPEEIASRVLAGLATMRGAR
jgi:shikimate kinase